MPADKPTANPQNFFSQAPQPEDEANPFSDVEFLPGLGIAVLWVVLSYVFVSLLLIPVHAG